MIEETWDIEVMVCCTAGMPMEVSKVKRDPRFFLNQPRQTTTNSNETSLVFLSSAASGFKRAILWILLPSRQTKQHSRRFRLKQFQHIPEKCHPHPWSLYITYPIPQKKILVFMKFPNFQFLQPLGLRKPLKKGTGFQISGSCLAAPKQTNRNRISQWIH